MTIEKIDEVLLEQKKFFQSGKTLDISFRIQMLKKLYSAVNKFQNKIVEALKKDLGKSQTESYMCEVGLVLAEISYMIKHVKKFAREKRVKTPLSQFAARSYKKPSPYGNVLIMSPWNYPFLLTIDPIVDALAAGNTVIVKPSAYSPFTSAVIDEMLSDTFNPNLIAVFTGGRKENAALLDKKFDLIFFTGSQNVGKEVLRRSAENLTPAILELGGKSPCIVDSSAKIELAAKRIVFGKFLNCGQTCVAPDYILCDKTVKEKLVEELKKQIVIQFGEKPLENENYGKIVNQKHFDRICSLLEREKIAIGGKSNEQLLKIEPTVLDNVSWDDAVMQEEIFGPVLPVLTFDKIDDVFTLLHDREKPLALYVFSENKANVKSITSRCQYGGGCVNDVVIHLATSELGFGGVGESGMGCYHGKDGFLAFSHVKNILDKKTWMDLPIRYQPYDKKTEKTIKKFLK